MEMSMVIEDVPDLLQTGKRGCTLCSWEASSKVIVHDRGRRELLRLSCLEIVLVYFPLQYLSGGEIHPGDDGDAVARVVPNSQYSASPIWIAGL